MVNKYTWEEKPKKAAVLTVMLLLFDDYIQSFGGTKLKADPAPCYRSVSIFLSFRVTVAWTDFKTWKEKSML